MSGLHALCVNEACAKPLRGGHDSLADHPGTVTAGPQGLCRTCYRSTSPERAARLAYDSAMRRLATPADADLLARMRKASPATFDYMTHRRSRGIPAEGLPFELWPTAFHYREG